MRCPRCGPTHEPQDPRKAGTCVRCGRMLTPDVHETHRHGEPFFDRHLKPAAAIFPPYAAMVLARFHVASREYGDTWRHRPLPGIVAEVSEEGLDVGGWIMLLAERLDELPPEIRGEVAALVAEQVADGARITARSRRSAALIARAATT